MASIKLRCVRFGTVPDDATQSDRDAEAWRVVHHGRYKMYAPRPFRRGQSRTHLHDLRFRRDRERLFQRADNGLLRLQVNMVSQLLCPDWKAPPRETTFRPSFLR